MKTEKNIEYSFNHTKTRLSERYDIEITKEEYEHLCSLVKLKLDIDIVRVEYQEDDTQYVYDLNFPRRNPIRVVWSDKRQCITTALPLGG